MITFNLVGQSFIPALQHGRLLQLSLRETLLQSAQIAELSHPSPLITVALHRLLLAVLQRIFGADPLSAQANWCRDGNFPAARIDAYLDRWRDRFDLFDAERPFLQLADFSIELSRRPVTALLPEAVSGNNKTLFDHSLDRAPAALDPAAAALALLVSQCFALGGGRTAFQYSSHAPSATAALFLAQGENLFETLLLNLMPQSAAEHAADRASWERERPWRTDEMRNGYKLAYAGPAQLYSLPARSVRLHAQEEAGCIAVRWVSLASGATFDDPLGTLEDPLVCYRQDEKRGRLALGLSVERAFWRDFQALRPFPAQNAAAWQPPAVISHAAELLEILDDGRPVAFMLYAQASDKAKVELWRHERFAIAAALRHDAAAWDVIRRALETAERAGKALGSACYALAGYLLSPRDGDADRKRAGQLARSFAVLPRYWSLLDVDFHSWLDEYDVHADDAQRERAWLQRVEHAVYSAWKLRAQMVSANFRGDQAIVSCQTPVDTLLRDLRRAIRELATDPGDLA